ncbi:HAMP domain-containing sensor histidine kinase [uncultured Jannaschia sp.]|uniref:HAMP domain-containing sensor histidine kinase n=1 Tax=uncultured Jannaschia sp. TaxID=293347 RepID=UPI0026293627|nr:HAMP domain-containing sensor histidine kinase [uncultured Jannaschia sp.]
MTPGLPGNPLRSTPLRLTLILIAIFTVSSLAIFSFSFLAVRQDFDDALRESVTQALASYQAIDEEEELRERLAAEVAAIPAEMTVLRFVPDAGASVGNVDGLPDIDVLRVLSEGEIAAGTRALSDSYLAIGGWVAGGHLVVAQTREQVVEMGELFLTVFLVGFLPTLAMASAAGLAVARRARDRVEAIRGTLAELTSGDLTARVPDVTDAADDLEQIGRAVNGMARAQATSTASLRQISADIAHDLKTPIQRVAIQLERLESRTYLTADQKGTVEAARAECDRIVRTFQSLLQIAQLEGGAVRDRFTPTDLRAVVSGVVDIYGPDAEASGHDLRLDVVGAGPFDVNGDRQLLGQVLANLIENGLRHVPLGGRIVVTLAREGPRAALVVADDGPGIPAEERDLVLRRLYRLERSRTTDGSGLGLSLVAAIAGLHDATLSLGDAAPGLIVRLAFPAAGAGSKE